MTQADLFESRLVAKIARKLNLPRMQQDAVAIAALLHFGRLFADPHFTDPSDPRTQTDVSVYMEVGAQIAMWQGWAPEVAEIIRHHHEHCDGSGLPNGLSADDIPTGSCILAVVIEFLRLSNRIQSGLTVQHALVRLQRHVGSHFRSDVAAALVEVLADESGTPTTNAMDHAVAETALSTWAPTDVQVGNEHRTVHDSRRRSVWPVRSPGTAGSPIYPTSGITCLPRRLKP